MERVLNQEAFSSVMALEWFEQDPCSEADSGVIAIPTMAQDYARNLRELVANSSQYSLEAGIASHEAFMRCVFSDTGIEERINYAAALKEFQMAFGATPLPVPEELSNFL